MKSKVSLEQNQPINLSLSCEKVPNSRSRFKWRIDW